MDKGLLAGRRLLALIITLLLIGAVAGCQSSGSSNPVTDQNTSQEEDEPVAIEDHINVQITSHQPGDTLSDNDIISVRITGDDETLEEVARLTLYCDEKIIANAPFDPSNGSYQFVFNASDVSAGNHFLKVIAEDESATVMATFAVITLVQNNASNEVPSVHIVYPQSGSMMNNSQRVTVDIDQDDVTGSEISFLKLFSGEQIIDTLPVIETVTQYEFEWDTSMLFEGDYTLEVQALDINEQIIASDQIMVSKGAETQIEPVVQIISPRDGCVVNQGKPRIIHVEVTDYQPGSTIERISISLNDELLESVENETELEYYWDSSDYELGEYTLRVTAEDSEGHRGVSQIGLTIIDSGDTESPFIEGFNADIPAGEIAPGTPVSFSVSVLDNVSVSTVALYNYEDKVADMSFVFGDEYRYVWIPDTVGEYQLSVRAIDTSDNVAQGNVLTYSVAEWTPPDPRSFHLVTEFEEPVDLVTPANNKITPQELALHDNPGNLSMYLHIPDRMKEDAPIVVALHGCNQTGSQGLDGFAQAYETASGWSELANQHKFYVIYPEQHKVTSFGCNPDSQDFPGCYYKVGNDQGCFNWSGYYGYQFDRDEGEFKSIHSMIRYVQEQYHGSTEEVFVTGLGAGGAMATALAAFYPDTIAGIAPMAGVPFNCANADASAGGVGNSQAPIILETQACYGTDLNGFSLPNGCFWEFGEACMSSDLVQRTPEVWGDFVRNHGYQGSDGKGFDGEYPTVMHWHGSSDNVIDDQNLVEMTEQWTNVHGTSSTPEETTSGSYLLREYKKAGKTRVATIELSGMRHGIAVFPSGGTGTAGEDVTGGNSSGPYAFDMRVWSSYAVADFWGILAGQGDRPEVRIVSPQPNELVGAGDDTTVVVNVEATDSTGIASVTLTDENDQLIADCSEDAGTYKCYWDVSNLSPGAYTIRAVADNGTYTGSAEVVVWVKEQKIEDQMPDFTLQDQDGEFVTFSEILSEPEVRGAVLALYIADFSPG